jgi:sulfide:quinone oxidoreductase
VSGRARLNALEAPVRSVLDRIQEKALTSGAPERCRVLIAGAGVAGLEALLALRQLAADEIELTLLAPSERFVYRPLLVAEPFGIGTATGFELEPLVAEAGAKHVHDSLASVAPDERIVTTRSGSKLPYDALLVASGAHPVASVPGALSFGAEEERRRFGVLLGELGHRAVKRVAFVVPRLTTWSIAAYELALLTAHERELRRLRGVELFLVTHEAAPLELLGDSATELVTARLEQAGVSLRVASAAERFERGELRFADGEPLAVDRAVALPGLEVPELAGLPQRQNGFVVTDVQMHVHGLERVWAAGDVTSFPIKQGGLAAQQADVAARSIAAKAGARVAVRAFQPVLRAALLTGEAPEYMRSPVGAPAESEAGGGRALWWPPVKLAGNYLAPYLSRAIEDERAADELVDLPASDDPSADEAEHDQAVALLLAAADADGAGGDFEGALRWLALAEHFNLVLPQEYVTRRYEWTHELDPSVAPDPAAGRIEPRLIDATAAISDLQRRFGWMRESEGDAESEMRADLSHLDRGLEQLIALSKRTGNYPRAERGDGT